MCREKILTAISKNPELIKLMTRTQLYCCFTEWCRYKWELDGLKEFLSLLFAEDRIEFFRWLYVCQELQIDKELFELIYPIVKNRYCNKHFFNICFDFVRSLYLSTDEWFDLLNHSTDLEWVDWSVINRYFSKNQYNHLRFVCEIRGVKEEF